MIDGLDHPEAVCWCPTSRTVYAGGEHGQIYRVEPEAGSLELVVQIPGGFILGLAVDGDGNLYACDIGNQCIHRVERDGTFSRYAGSLSYPNSLAFDVEGRLYASDSGSWESSGDGSIVCIERDHKIRRVTAPTLRFPNGIAVRDDWLYIVESTFPGISKVPLCGGDPVAVIELPLTIPDGIAFDADGGLWIGCWQPSRILHLSTAGELSIVADDWSGIHILTPNNVAFFGEGLKDLVLSSLGGNFLRRFCPHVAGAPLHYPRVS